MVQDLLRSITNKVLQRAKLPTAFAKLYPLVRTYVATRCFGKVVDVDSEAVRTHLRRLELHEGIARYLARKIAALTVEKRLSSSTRPTSSSPAPGPLVGDATCSTATGGRPHGVQLRGHLQRLRTPLCPFSM